MTRQGAEAWIEVTRPMAPPSRGRFVLRAAKGPPMFATLTEAGDVSLADTRPGQIYPLRLTWRLQPGKYTLSYEPGLPYASIELGEIEIK